MRLEFPQINNTNPVDSGKSDEQKITVQRNISAIVKNSETDEKATAVMPGMVGTYSIASLKAAAEHQPKFAAVAENNILASQSVSRIPERLLQMFNT